MTERMTPSQVDEILAKNYYRASTLEDRAERLRDSIKRYDEREAMGRIQHPGNRTQSVDGLAKAEAELALIAEENEPLEAIYKAQRWNRYFLVQNTGGHVHRGMRCTSCFPTTRYAWLTTLSDCDEGQMIEEWGETACTVCFPNAPYHPAFVRSTEERKAMEAQKVDSQCKGSGYYPIRIKTSVTHTNYQNQPYEVKQSWRVCPECNEVATITKGGKVRTHKKGDRRVWKDQV